MAKILLICSAICLLATLVYSRGSLVLGNTNISGGGVHLIYHEIHEKSGIIFTKRTEDVEVKTTGNEVIRGISVQDLKGDGESYIKRGGIGLRNVTIKLKSGKGHGYKFIVDVFAS